MRTGEKVIFGGLFAFAVIAITFKGWQVATNEEVDPGIPFYTTADSSLTNKASLLIKQNNCKDCHSLWATRDLTQNVPAPRLDGMGTLKSEQWLYDYFSSENPQDIVPSRLKQKYRMPSFASLSEENRRVLASYISSLKVEDWYLEESLKHEYEKITGNPYTGTPYLALPEDQVQKVSKN